MENNKSCGQCKHIGNGTMVNQATPIPMTTKISNTITAIKHAFVLLIPPAPEIVMIRQFVFFNSRLNRS